MATLNEVMKETADAIREKTGTTDKIAPINFAEEIRGITSGGGESGGSNIEYIDLNGNSVLVDILTGGIVEMKITIENTDFPVEGMIGVGTAVFPLLTQLKNMGATINLIAISYNRDAVAITKQDGVVVTQTAYELLVREGESYVELYNSAPRLTKEQFYDLNA